MRVPDLFSRMVLVGCAGLLAACSDMGSEPQNTPPPAVPGQVSFSQNVIPIFNSSGCTGCHGGNGGLVVGTVQQLLQGGNNGPAIVPGSAASSILVQKLSPTPPFGERMPQGGPYLADSAINVIGAWIDQGALNN
jgi:hypothetical protein